MKIHLSTFGSATVFCIAFVITGTITSCKKDNSYPLQTNQITSQQADDLSILTTQAGIKTLVLRPGPYNGQDVYVDKLSDYPAGNQNYVPELPINKWTNGGLPVTTRSFIKFDSLVRIPSNAKILNATLYLYGLSQSLNSPQGNSYYPGSPYNGYGDNRCLLQRVLANWNESSLTFDNQPFSTAFGQDTLAASNNQWNYNAVTNVTNLVRFMVANPSKNFGFSIKLLNESAYRSVVFGSSEQADPTLRPRLVVIYQ